VDRCNLVYRILEIIHEVTGEWLEEDSYLDFEVDHKGKMEDIAFNLWDEFLCVDREDAKKWDYVTDIIRDVERRMKGEE